MKISEALKVYDCGEILSCDDDLGIALCRSLSVTVNEYRYYIYTSVFGGDVLAACVRSFIDKEKAENAYNALVAV